VAAPSRVIPWRALTDPVESRCTHQYVGHPLCRANSSGIGSALKVATVLLEALLTH